MRDWKVVAQTLHQKIRFSFCLIAKPKNVIQLHLLFHSFALPAFCLRYLLVISIMFREFAVYGLMMDIKPESLLI